MVDSVAKLKDVGIRQMSVALRRWTALGLRGCLANWRVNVFDDVAVEAQTAKELSTALQEAKALPDSSTLKLI